MFQFWDLKLLAFQATTSRKLELCHTESAKVFGRIEALRQSGLRFFFGARSVELAAGGRTHRLPAGVGSVRELVKKKAKYVPADRRTRPCKGWAAQSSRLKPRLFKGQWRTPLARATAIAVTPLGRPRQWRCKTLRPLSLSASRPSSVTVTLTGPTRRGSVLRTRRCHCYRMLG